MEKCIAGGRGPGGVRGVSRAPTRVRPSALLINANARVRTHTAFGVVATRGPGPTGGAVFPYRIFPVDV